MTFAEYIMISFDPSLWRVEFASPIQEDSRSESFEKIDQEEYKQYDDDEEHQMEPAPGMGICGPE